MVGKVRFGVAAAVAVVVVIAGAMPVSAAPNTLDSTFGGGGRVQVSITSGATLPYSLALQGDGKIVLVGRTGGAGGRMFAVRLWPSGRLDRSFSGDGKAFVDFGGGNDFANGVVIQPDGGIVLAGGAANGSKVALARLTPAGALDPTFSGDGKLALDTGNGADFAAAVALQGDSIVLAGQSGVNTALWRFTAAGVRDTTFGSNGRRVRSFATTEDLALDLAVDGNDNLVIVGSTDPSGGNTAQTIVARFTPTGEDDNTFSEDGDATLDVVPGQYEDGTEVLVQPDGAIVVGGEANRNLSLLRFTDAGELDATFDGDGRVRINRPGQYEWVSGLGLQPDGRIVLAGAQVVNNWYYVLVGRMNADGTPDTTFAPSSGSAFDTRRITNQDDYATELRIQPDGKIVVAASAYRQRVVGVLRLLGG